MMIKNCLKTNLISLVKKKIKETETVLKYYSNNLKPEMPTKPKLIRTTESGGTIHTYPLTGGQTTFERYLGCYLGSCKFCNDIEEATAYIEEQVIQ